MRLPSRKDCCLPNWPVSETGVMDRGPSEMAGLKERVVSCMRDA